LTVYREEDGRKRMKQLQKKVADVKEEKIVEMEQRNEMIAHLKDQLQVGGEPI
jgi:kinesin family protein 6/9